MEVKPGYKKTDIGVIPEDWEIKRFSELFEFRNGVNADKDAYGEGIRFINVLEPIMHSHLHSQDIPGRVSLPGRIIDSYVVSKGDVIFNRTSETESEIGLAATYLGRESVVFGGFVIRGRPIGKVIDHIYSGYAFRASFIRSQIVPMGQGAVRANIGQQSLGTVLAPIPPYEEQRAIGAALGDTDALLEGLNRLLAKKRAIKQAAMQQLLTGQARLPGFSGTWEVMRLGDLAEIRSGGTPSTRDSAAWDGAVPWCTPTDITALDGGKYLAVTNRTITEHGLRNSSAELIPARSIVMTSRATIGECAINVVPMATNQGFKNLVPFDSVDVEFLYYLLCAQTQGLVGLSAGSTFLEIGKAQIRQYEVRLPSTKVEQAAISAVLGDMDAEISALEARRTKVRAIKQAMMQELLTGRTRLI